MQKHLALVLTSEPALRQPLWMHRYSRLPSPRFFLTHAILFFASAFPKVVYVVRDPRDVLVSYYHHHKKMAKGFDKSLDEFVRGFDDLLPCSWSQHVGGWLAERERAKFLLVSYEQMKDDAETVLKTVLEFARFDVGGMNSNSIVEMSSLENMKKLEKKYGHAESKRIKEYGYIVSEGNKELDFIRRGKVEGYKDELSPDLVSFVNQKTRDAVRKYSLKYLMDD